MFGCVCLAAASIVSATVAQALSTGASVGGGPEHQSAARASLGR
jgi:hypothetical protein